MNKVGKLSSALRAIAVAGSLAVAGVASQAAVVFDSLSGALGAAPKFNVYVDGPALTDTLTLAGTERQLTSYAYGVYFDTAGTATVTLSILDALTNASLYSVTDTQTGASGDLLHTTYTVGATFTLPDTFKAMLSITGGTADAFLQFRDSTDNSGAIIGSDAAPATTQGLVLTADASSTLPPVVPGTPSVPEPASYALILTALAGLGFARRNKA